MKENFKVYVHTCPFGRKYIGITKQDVQDRWRHGNNYEGNTYFYRAIQKYGWDNFKHEVLYTNLTKEEACLKEQELIKKYDTMNRAHGFNRTPGGEHFTLTPEMIEHCREAAYKMLAKTTPEQRKHWYDNRDESYRYTKEYHEKLSDSLKKLWCNPEHRKYISETNSLIIKDMWKDPSYRNNIMNGIKRREERKNKILSKINNIPVQDIRKILDDANIDYSLSTNKYNLYVCVKRNLGIDLAKEEDIINLSFKGTYEELDENEEGIK